MQIQGERKTPIVAEHEKLSSSVRPMHKYGGMFHTVHTIAREEGVHALYNGLLPGLQRQLAFCSVRIGLYDSVKDMYKSIFQGLYSLQRNPQRCI